MALNDKLPLPGVSRNCRYGRASAMDRDAGCSYAHQQRCPHVVCAHRERAKAPARKRWRGGAHRSRQIRSSTHGAGARPEITERVLPACDWSSAAVERRAAYRRAMRLCNAFQFMASFRVRIALEIKGLTTDYDARAPEVKGEQLQPGFAQIAPSQRLVPPMLATDDGELLWSSPRDRGTLTETHPGQPCCRVTGPRARVRGLPQSIAM